jgi:hypothetical protein
MSDNIEQFLVPVEPKTAACKFITSKTMVMPKPGKFPDVENKTVKSNTAGTDNIEDQKYQKDEEKSATALMQQALKQAADGLQGVYGPQNMPAGLSAADQQEYDMDPSGFGGRSAADQQEYDMDPSGFGGRSHLGPPTPQQRLENDGYTNVASHAGTLNSPRGTTAGPQPTHDQYGRPAGTPPGAHGDANSDGVPDDRQPRGTTAGPPPRGGSHNPANQQFNQSGSPYGPNYNPNAAPPITKGTPSSVNSPLRSSKKTTPVTRGTAVSSNSPLLGPKNGSNKTTPAFISGKPGASAPLVPSLRGIKQAGIGDYISANPFKWFSGEMGRGRKLDKQLAKSKVKKTAPGSVEHVNKQIDKGGLSAGSSRKK